MSARGDYLLIKRDKIKPNIFSTLRYYSIPGRIVRPKMSNIGEGLEKVELSYITGKGGSVKWYGYFGKMYPSFFEHITTLKPNSSTLFFKIFYFFIILFFSLLSN